MLARKSIFNLDKVIRVDSLINNNNCKVLIDSGASVLAIDYEFAVFLNLKINDLVENFKVCGGKISSKGICHADLKIGNIQKKVVFDVIENLGEKIILGISYFRLFDLSIAKNLDLVQDDKTIFYYDHVPNKKLKNSSDSNSTSEDPNTSLNIKSSNSDIPINISNEFDEKISHLVSNKSLYEKFKLLFSKIHKAFALGKEDIGCIDNIECEINLKNNIVLEKNYPYIDKKNVDLINEQVLDLERRNLIQRSKAIFAAPVILVDKKDEGAKTRLCVDYRNLNKLVEKIDHKFPIIEDIITRLRGSKYFSCLDVAQGFYHIKIKESDRFKTAFKCLLGIFEWIVTPFGYKNSPAVFQKALENVLKIEGCSEFAMNYIDDIIIFSDSIEEHLVNLEKVLKACIKNNIKLKLSKCQFLKTEVNYLGLRVKHNSIEPLVSNIEAIKEFPRPTSIAAINQFVGKCNYYRRFIKNISIKLGPLFEMIKLKPNQFYWNDRCEKSFQSMKKELCKSPVLEIFDRSKKCFVYTDASRIGIGAVLKQLDDQNVEKPIAYFSRKLAKYQKNYPIVELECLAIVESVRHWHKYLANKEFEIITDHRALIYLQTITHKNSRLLRWSLELSMYDYNISYRKGEENVEADCLSRNPLELTSEEKENFMKVVNLISKKEYIENLTLKELENKNNKLVDGFLFKKDNNSKKIVVPEKLESVLINRSHKQFSHCGVDKLTSKIRQCYFIPRLREKVVEILKNCETCIKCKERGYENLGFLSKFGPPSEPLDIVSIDTVGGLNCKSSKTYLHIAIDNFTRYVWVLASKTQNVKDFEKLVELVISSSGKKPKIILCDMYSALRSEKFETFLTSKDIQLVHVPPNAAHANGLVERVNQSLIVALRCELFDLEYEKSWSVVINKVVDNYNNLEHSSTGFTPNFLLFGTEKQIGLVENNLIDINKARTIALKKSFESNAKNARYYNKNRVDIELETGMLVYVRNKQKPNIDKLDPLYEGPMMIVEKLGDHCFNVLDKNKIKKVHVCNIRLAIPSLCKLTLN